MMMMTTQKRRESQLVSDNLRLQSERQSIADQHFIYRRTIRPVKLIVKL